MSGGIWKEQITDKSEINFAVPSFPVHRTFDPYGDCGERYPGMLNDILETIPNDLHHQSAFLTYDGKKLKQGLTEKSSDVDLLG